MDRELDIQDAVQAIARGRTDRVLDLLRRVPAGPWPAHDGASPLQWLAYYGDVTALRLMLGAGASLAEFGPDLGLNGAVFHGHWRLVQFLLQQGAPVSHADPDTLETPLHSAVVQRDGERRDRVLRVLLDAGADVHARTRAGAATGAFMRDARTRGETALHRAAAFGGEQTLRLLLEAGADPAAADANGDTPLSWASWHQRPLPILRLLLHGAHRIHPEARTMGENLLGDP